MPLNAANMVLNGHLIHDDVLQFINLLTGVMTDQPVTIANRATIGSPNPVVIGVIDASSPANPSIAGTGPNGSLQLGTAGLARWLVTPGGHFIANFDNTYDLGQSTNRPRNVYVGGTEYVGPTATIHSMASPVGGLAVEAPGANGYVYIGAQNTSILFGNAYYDGTNFQRYTTANPSTYFSVDSTGYYFRGVTAASGSIPPGTWNNLLAISQAAVMSIGNNATPPTIHPNAAATDRLMIEAPSASGQGVVGISGRAASQVSGNAYYDGTAWQRYDTTLSAILTQIHQGGWGILGTPVGANPITWTTWFNLNPTTGVISIGPNGTPPLIHSIGTARPAALAIESPADFVGVFAQGATAYTANAYFDGTAYQRYATASPAILLQLNNGTLNIQIAPAGANPITFTSLLSLNQSSGLTLTNPGGLTVNQGPISFAGAGPINLSLPNYTISSGTAVNAVAGAWVDLPNTFTPTVSGTYVVLLEIAFTNGATAGVIQGGLSSVPSTSTGTTLLVSSLGYQTVPGSSYHYLTLHAVVSLTAGTQYRQQAYCNVVGGNFTGRLMAAFRIS